MMTALLIYFDVTILARILLLPSGFSVNGTFGVSSCLTNVTFFADASGIWAYASVIAVANHFFRGSILLLLLLFEQSEMLVEIGLGLDPAPLPYFFRLTVWHKHRFRGLYSSQAGQDAEVLRAEC